VEKVEKSSRISILVIIVALNEEEGIGPSLAETYGTDALLDESGLLQGLFGGLEFEEGM